MHLLTLSICRGFPNGYIGTNVVFFMEPCHIADRGWLLRVLVDVGFTHVFHDEVCHVDGSSTPCPFELCKVNSFPVCHVS